MENSNAENKYLQFIIDYHEQLSPFYLIERGMYLYFYYPKLEGNLVSSRVNMETKEAKYQL